MWCLLWPLFSCCFLFFFFFQAEDGIRDAQESRGLGDVYKRQNGDIAGLAARTDLIADSWFSPAGFNRGVIRGAVTVSYTHLTLPTNREV